MAFNRRDGRKDSKGKGRGKSKPRGFGRRKVCRFCVDKNLKIDYKDGRVLLAHTTERGKILPRRISGSCAHHQRELTTAIKRARILAFIPFTATQVPMA